MDGALGLHPRRVEILKALARRAGGEPPTMAEIAAGVGLRSTQTVHHHLGRLEAEGYIERGEAPSRKRRPVRLTERGWGVVGVVPVMGRVAAGRGLEAIPDLEPFSLVRLLESRRGGRRYMVHSVGQSMVGAGIEDGDLLIVEEDESPPDGTVVVALLGESGAEITVKRFFRDGEMVRLRPHNGDHEDIVVPANEVRIQGRVEYVLHPPRG
jgi:repressor LexA